MSTFELPPLNAWAASGLDLRPYAGREVEQLAFWVERSPNDGLAPVARLVYADRRFVGGWIQVDATQAFRLDDRAHAIAASPRPLAAPTAAPNRYPAGVNVVAEYDLARATDVYVKPHMPNAKPVTAPALADLVRLLDRTLPTQPAPSRRDGYWVVGFRIDDTPLVFEYFADAGLLVQRDDGYAISPGAAFVRRIGAAP